MNTSCGIIPFRKNGNGEMEFFLGHPGGNHPRQENLWMFLKGAVEDGEDWADTALREFGEESGMDMGGIEKNELIPLGSVQQNPHKVAVAFGLNRGDIDEKNCFSNNTEEGFPEIDRYRWMTYEEVCKFTHPAHISFFDRLTEIGKSL